MDFIKDKKSKIQHFIQFDEPKNLEESMRKDKYLYEQNKRRPNFPKAWADKKRGNMDQRKKVINPPFVRNISQEYQQGKTT